MRWTEVAQLRGNHASFAEPATINDKVCFKKDGLWYIKNGGGFFKCFSDSVVTELEEAITPEEEEG